MIGRNAPISKEKIEEAINNTKSMIAAARFLNVSRDRFKRYANMYGLFKSNQSGKGDFDLSDDEFFKNNRRISSCALKTRLLNIKPYKCECCGISEWNNKKIILEIHHIDGNHYNNELSNLKLLCPNCHSQTLSWCGKNKNKNKNKLISDDEFKNALINNKSIYQALISLNLSPSSGNYNRANKLLEDIKIKNG